MTWQLDQPESRPLTGAQKRLDFPEPSAVAKADAAFTAGQQPPSDDMWDGAEVISSYSRAQAIADGVLVDLTEWASAEKGFMGGFTLPLAVTAGVWADIEEIPALDVYACQDVRGRAHDVLWMASLAARRSTMGTNRLCFTVHLPTGADAHPDPEHSDNVRRYIMVGGPGDDGAPVLTIMRPDEE